MDNQLNEVNRDKAIIIERWKNILHDRLKEPSEELLGIDIQQGFDAFYNDLISGSLNNWISFVSYQAERLAGLQIKIENFELVIGSFKTALWDYALEKWQSEPEKSLLFLRRAHELIGAGRLEMGKVFVKKREEIIRKQQRAIKELSTPVMPLLDNILVVPLIGTIDTARAHEILENLLQAVTEVEAEIVIIDITGVPIVDTNVAHHLIKAYQAAKLLGAECILVGMKPEIAETIVNLDIDFGNIVTKSTLEAGIRYALQLQGLIIVQSTANGEVQ